MLIADVVSPAVLLAQTEAFTKPAYFEVVAVLLIIAGALGWLVAAVLGFARARAFGASIRWFAMAAVCLVIYHLHLVLVAFSGFQNDSSLPLKIGAFFNLFVVIGAICAIIGFVKLTNTANVLGAQSADRL